MIIGGTFDSLHQGHIALIRKAFDIADYVCIGLTTDAYVRKAKPEGKAATYSKRKAQLERLVKGFSKRFEIVPLEDRFGPSTAGDFDAIVVSPGTLPAALAINKIRMTKGLPELSIIKIRYVRAYDSRPISTTRIRKGEIDRDGNAVRHAYGHGKKNHAMRSFK